MAANEPVPVDNPAEILNACKWCGRNTWRLDQLCSIDCSREFYNEDFVFEEDEADWDCGRQIGWADDDFDGEV